MNVAMTRRLRGFIIVFCLLLFFTLLAPLPRKYIYKVLGITSVDNDLPYTPKYKPKPDWTPPPVRDPFPLLETSMPPPVPPWNVPKKNLHEKYNMNYAPPLFIGFTRGYPLLLQTVVSYITAGWPPEQIYVIENTGAYNANKQGNLTLQNPFYLNWAALGKLKVNIVQAPVRLNFAQLQNFYTSLAHDRDWPYYFWSHQDVVAFSEEDGNPHYSESGYMTIYERALMVLEQTVTSDNHWAARFFAYDYLTLVNRAAYTAVGGWDTWIPFYATDCDMHSRLIMEKWNFKDAKAGIVVDVASVLDDLRVLYREDSIEPSWTDPNPQKPPRLMNKRGEERDKKAFEVGGGDIRRREQLNRHSRNDGESPTRDETDSNIDYFRRLRDVSENMAGHKRGDRGRNTWQSAQRGGVGEPYYYPSHGFDQAFGIHVEAGREVYRKKWGTGECGIENKGLSLWDQWLVESRDK